MLVAIYVATAATSAFLLFLVQPMFAKMTLPLLGGTPAIWNTAMVFFQLVLLLGYAYAHFSTRYLGVRIQAYLHFIILLAAVFWLPLSLGSHDNFGVKDYPAFWLLTVYAGSIGVPFFALSTMSPLIQSWFAHTNHPSRFNPYFLYAASNAGSMFALLAYPILLEPAIGLNAQGNLWALIYGFFLLLSTACVVMMKKSYTPVAKSEISSPVVSLSIKRKLKWMFLAAVPSSLLLSVTTHITTDVASAPFLWVVPLSLFLLTFILVFSNRVIVKHEWMLQAQVYGIIIIAVWLYFVFDNMWVGAAIHLGLFFINAMVCHGELAKDKPDASELTTFFLFMSLGGALGGIFTALIAPVIFDIILEYPLGIVLACLARPDMMYRDSRSKKSMLITAIVFGLLVYIICRLLTLDGIKDGVTISILLIAYIIYACITHASMWNRIAFTACTGVLVLFGYTIIHSHAYILENHRSFYASNKITKSLDGKRMSLQHGTTVHGVQQLEKNLWAEPASYYHRSGPAGQIFSQLNEQKRIQSVGVVGLGLGALTCYSLPNQKWWLYELDPLIVEIATEYEHFHYMRNCAEGMEIVIGDARLSLADDSSEKFDLLVVDAFSSDSIPVHLLTLEAIELYMNRLSDDGVLLMHVSNKHLNIKPVIANIVAELGISAWSQYYLPDEDANTPSEWVIVGNDKNLELLVRDQERWSELSKSDSVGLWTDDYSTLLQIIK